MNSAKTSHPTVIAALKAGRPVDVEAPGWQDTGAGPCPTCGLPCWHFLADRAVQFVYQVDYAWPHRCGQAVHGLYADPTKVRRLQAVQRELNALQRWNDWPEADPFNRRS